MQNIGDIALVGAERFGERLALRLGDASITHRALGDRSARLAAALRSMPGVAPGDRVAVIAIDRFETVEAYLACGIAGLVSVVLNSQLQAPELDYALQDCGAKAIIAPGSHEQILRLCQAHPSLSQILYHGGESSSYERALGSAMPMQASEPVDPNGAAMIAYTSGTTGAPKGAVVSHAGIISTVRVTAPVAYGIPPYGRAVFAASLSFAATVWCYVFPHLAVGGSVNILGRTTVSTWIEQLRRDKATFTYVPSPLVREFAAAVAANPDVLEHLQTVNHGGSAVPKEDLEALFAVVGHRFRESWGMTETTGVVTAMAPGDYATGAIVEPYLSVGRALPTASLRVLLPNGKRASPGEVGELAVQGECIFLGYWNRPEATSEAIDSEGYFRTGDLGYVDESGYAFLTGRTKELIISGGINVYPLEIEQVLSQLDGVVECAVIGTPSKRWGETVTAIVVPRRTDMTEHEVVRFCHGRLASYKRPKRVVFVDELPRSVSRKVKKHEIQAMLRDRVWPTDE